MKEQVKKILSILLITILVISMFPPVFAAGTAELTAGDWKYKVIEEKIMITRYIGNETEVVIPSEIDGIIVTMIGQDTFYFSNEIEAITIPESISEIVCLWSVHYSIFEQCHSLENIYVDDNNKVFSSQDGILYTKDKTGLLQYPQGKKETSFIIPDSVRYCASYAFLDCTQLTSITIPDSMIGISNSVFSGCAELSNINIPKSVKNIGHYAFANCSNLSNVLIPNSVTEIGQGAFATCTSLSNITIPDSVIKLGKGAFEGCSNLKKAIFMGKKPIYWEEPPKPIDENYFIDQSIFNKTHKDFVLYYPRWYEKNWSDYTYYPKQSHCEGGIPVEKVILNKNKIALNKNKKYRLKGTVIPNDAINKNVTWTTSNSKVAVVSQAGLVTAKGKGKCKITVVTEDGKESASCQITVNVPVKKVKLNKKKIKIKKGKKYNLKATITPKDASVKKVSWKSSNKKIATVSKKGIVKAKRKGKCTITVITKDGRKKAKCKVTKRCFILCF